MFMGNSKSTPVIGKGKVLLKLTFGKVLALNDVLHVLDIRWNLVLVFLLGKTRVRILFDFDKIVLTKNDTFVGKGYCNKDLFMLNVYDVINNNASSSSTYIVDSCDIWYDRLRHVNFSYMKKMVELSLILRTDKGGEYESNPFNSFCEDHGIIHETAPSKFP